MKKRLLVLGSLGMLGHQVVRHFLELESYEVIDVAHREKLREETILLDVTNKDALQTLLQEIKPDCIINCVGVLIRGSQSDIANAIYINAYLPHQLANIAQGIGAKVVHISTDCVFSGDKGKYVETDERDGRDTYSRTKILGELIDGCNVTLRTSLIGAELKRDGEGLFHWFMHQSGTIHGYTKAIWSGVTTLELAKVIQRVIEQEITGLYHVTNNKSISKNELLYLFKKYTKKEIEILPMDGKSVDKSFIDTRGEVDYTLPDYDVMVAEMIHFIEVNKKLYAHA